MRGTADPSATARALRRAGELGPYFTVAVPTPLPRQRAATPRLGGTDDADLTEWQRFSGLLADPVQLRAAVDATGAQLGSDGRVAASMWSLGWAARLLSPLLGSRRHLGVAAPAHAAISCGGGPPSLAPCTSRRTPTGLHLPLEDVAVVVRQVHAVAVEGLLAPLLAATEAAYDVSSQVLWGNAASALAGTAGVLARARPAQASVVRAVVAGLLGVGELRRRGDVGPDGSFVRRSCCLAYRVPPGALCGDCVLADRDRPGGTGD